MRVLTLGTFDLFHEGHVNLLRRCRVIAGAAGTVIVGLNTDEFVARYKGAPPVIGWHGRMRVLQACRYVDGVIANGQPDGSARDVILAARPDRIVIGSDWRDRDYLGQLGITEALLFDMACRIVYVPYTPGVSTTAIKAAVA